ncbi:MAG TPA: HutD family protein [Planctomycetota bacterium]|nr:HutD family protein [Planctomycetota bacterium]
MIEIVHLGLDDARATPWRNGGGTTRELWLWPEGARFEALDFDLRVARARVARDGPFSEFPGFERLLVVLDGAGLELEHGGRRARLRPLEPYRFDGGEPAGARLVRGAVEDLNVLVRHATAAVELEVLRLGARAVRTTLERGQAFAHLASGSAQARVTGEDEPFELEAGDSLWVDGLAGGEELDLRGGDADTLAVVVRLMPRR